MVYWRLFVWKFRSTMMICKLQNVRKDSINVLFIPEALSSESVNRYCDVKYDIPRRER